MKTNTIIAVLAVLLALVSGLFVGLVMQPEQKEVPTAQEIAALVSVPVAPVANASGCPGCADKLDALSAQVSSLDEFEVEADEKLQNDTAKALVLEKIGTRDFKEAVLALLNDEEGYSVEDYKNVTVYYTKIQSVDLGEESAEVEVTVKVASFNDGDEEDSFKVKLTGTFLVEGLDVDDIEDAEVEDFNLDFVLEYD